MEKILNEIKTTPGVMGSAVYTCKDGIIASNLPEILKSDKFQRIGKLLQRVFRLNQRVSLDVNQFEIQYDEALLLVQRLCDHSSLIIICDPDAEVQEINMNVSLLTADLVGKIEGCEPE